MRVEFKDEGALTFDVIITFRASQATEAECGRSVLSSWLSHSHSANAQFQSILLLLLFLFFILKFIGTKFRRRKKKKTSSVLFYSSPAISKLFRISCWFIPRAKAIWLWPWLWLRNRAQAPFFRRECVCWRPCWACSCSLRSRRLVKLSGEIQDTPSGTTVPSTTSETASGPMFVACSILEPRSAFFFLVFFFFILCYQFEFRIRLAICEPDRVKKELTDWRIFVKFQTFVNWKCDKFVWWVLGVCVCLSAGSFPGSAWSECAAYWFQWRWRLQVLGRFAQVGRVPESKLPVTQAILSRDWRASWYRASYGV